MTDKQNPSILKNTREAKGLTLEIVHEATKIPMDALRAIEEGYSVRILTPFYYRGFIKIYAEFLGLNVAEMYKEYGLDQPSKPAAVSTPVKPSRAEAKPNVFVENLQDGVSSVLKPKTFKIILRIAGFLLLLFVLVKMIGCVASHIHFHSTRTSAPKHAVVHHQAAAVVAQEQKPAPAPVEVKHDAVQAPSDDDKVEVAVRAVKDTWLRVKADDKVVFQTTLSKGSMESWSADDHIELSGRNIEQLDMEVNGKHIGSLGGGEHRIRRVWITSQGLTVKK